MCLLLWNLLIIFEAVETEPYLGLEPDPRLKPTLQLQPSIGLQLKL